MINKKDSRLVLFSVVIPTYQRQEQLKMTLDSVLRQTFTDYEIIVVDDGSTDGTWDFLTSLGPRVKTLRQENAGAGAARNLGAKHATGEYLAFLDSDDLWFPWTLETYAKVVKLENFPAFITGKPLIFHSPGDLAQVCAGVYTADRYPDFYASSDEWRWFGASSFVIRKSCFDEVGGFHPGWGAEDADLVMMLGIAPVFVSISEPYTFGYREQPVSLKAMPTYTLAGSRLMIKKEKQGQYPGGTERCIARREMLSRQIRPVSFDCLHKNLRRDAWCLYFSLFLWNLSLGRWRYVFGFPLKSIFR